MKPCPMCAYYDVPGFILNAHQIIPCYQCNPSNILMLPKPEVLRYADTDS